MLANNPEIFPSVTGIIPYSDFNSRSSAVLKLDQAYLKGFGDYVFTYPENGGVGEDGIGWTILYFAKAKTDVERNAPFKTWYTKKQATFDAVLSGVAIFSTVQAGQTIQFPKYYGLAEYVGPCLFKIEQFLSEVPWNANTLQATAPQPQNVDAWIFSSTGQKLHIFQPRVLHPKLDFNPPGTTANLAFKTGVVPSLGGDAGAQYLFPPTSPEGRSWYIYSDSQDPVQGQYLRERATIYPPTSSQPLR